MPELIPTASNAVAAARKKRQAGVAPVDKPIDGVTNFKQTPTGGATLEYQGKPMTLQGPMEGDTPIKGNPYQKPGENLKAYQARGARETGYADFLRYGPEADVPTPGAPKTGRFEANGDQAAKPYMKADGTFDPSYVPKSESEIMSLPIDDYTRQNYLRNFYASKGLNFDPASTPKSFDEEASIFLENQAKKKSAFEQEAAEAKKNLAEQKTGQKSYNDMAMTSNREGVVSQGNAMTRDQVDLALESRYNSKMRDLQQQMDDLNFQMTSQQGQFIAGREDQIRAQMKAVADSMADLEKEQGEKQKQAMDILNLLSDNGALANLDPDSIKYLEEAMPGAPPGVVSLLANAATRKYGDEQTKQQLENATKSIGMLKTMADAGIVMDNKALLSMSQETGIPLDILMQGNMAAQMVIDDKKMDQATKQAQLQGIFYDVDQKAKGIFTAAAQNADYLKRLYAEGASADTISAFKQAAGITDQNDPVYRARLQEQQLNNSILQKKLNGEPIGYDELQQYASNFQTLVSTGQLASAVIPAGKMYSVNPTASGVTINAQNGASAGQCGHFVNDVFGKRIVKDSYQQKLSLCDPAVTIPTPGMAFVQDVNTKYGHIGLVEAVHPEKGTMDIVESNWRGNEKIGRRTIPISAAAGFIRPPGGQEVKGSDGGAGSEYQKYLKEATSSGLPLNDAKKYAADKVKDSLSGAPTGKIDKDTFTQENTLRDEFTKNTQSFVKIRDSYNVIQAAAQDPSAAGDLSLIFAYMKVLDPNSTVREGEFANAENAGSAWNKIGVTYNKVMSGERLSEDQRKDFVNQAKKLYDTQKSGYDKQVSQTRSLANSYGLNPDRVMYNFANDEANPSVPGSSGNYFQDLFGKLTSAPKPIDSHGEYYIPTFDPNHLTNLEDL